MRYIIIVCFPLKAEHKGFYDPPLCTYASVSWMSRLYDRTTNCNSIRDHTDVVIIVWECSMFLSDTVHRSEPVIRNTTTNENQSAFMPWLGLLTNNRFYFMSSILRIINNFHSISFVSSTRTYYVIKSNGINRMFEFSIFIIYLQIKNWNTTNRLIFF